MAETGREQADALKEKLSSMSPEEIKEFQKQRCIFCQIISGKVASKKVYSDERCTALLDINPANPGHILLIPNEHYGIMPLIPGAEISHMFMVSKALARAVLKGLEAQGALIFVANGVAAGQKAQHFMVHIIPRKEGDNLRISIPEKDISPDDLKKVIGRMKPAVEKILGKSVSKASAEHHPMPAEKASAPAKSGRIESDAEEQIPAEEDEQVNEKGFITSGTARRFHSAECPFAQNIPEERRVYITPEEAAEQGKLPCSCTGIIVKKEQKAKAAPKKAQKKSAGKSHKQKKEEEPENDGKGASLDDISRMLAGGR